MTAPCKDCGRDTEPMENGEPLYEQFDRYLVRDEIWAEARMGGWDSGYLCTYCLSKRLGRDLTNADYLVWPVGTSPEGVEMAASADYLKHPSISRAARRRAARAITKLKGKGR